MENELNDDQEKASKRKVKTHPKSNPKLVEKVIKFFNRDKFDFEQFKTYVNTYNPTPQVESIQEDMIYGVGICTKKEFKYIRGYRKFKSILIDRWSKKDKLFTLELTKDLIAEFSDRKFGTERDFKAPLHHLKEEVDETIEDGDILEYADCMLLLLDSFRKKYPDKHTDYLLEKCAEKVSICEDREWNKADENGVIKHIK